MELPFSDNFKKISGLMHLAEKGRYLVFGSNLVLASRPEKIVLVLYCSSLAANSTKKLVTRFPNKTVALPFSPGTLFNQPDLKVIALKNQGLAGKIKELINNLENSAE